MSAVSVLASDRFSKLGGGKDRVQIFASNRIQHRTDTVERIKLRRCVIEHPPRLGGAAAPTWLSGDP